VYRVWQFMRALTARVRREDWTLVERLLTPPQLRLFRSMSRRDQRHGLDLVYALQRQGHRAPELFQAALLHDVGKARYLSLWHRVAIVLLERFDPAMLGRLADDRPGSRGYPFSAYLGHPRWGAERARKAGCGRLTVELIKRHHDPLLASAESEADRLLVTLQAADGRA
jgi:hypothetical protein